MEKGKFVFVEIAANVMMPSFQAFPELLTGSDTGACTLEIYGNANEDDRIDILDFTLADANFNGERSRCGR